MRFCAVILARVSLIFLLVVWPSHGEDPADPIGRERLTEAYVFLRNAEALTQGAPMEPRPKLVKEAKGLSTHELRGQIGVLADRVEKGFSKVPTEAQELAVTTRMRATRITLMSPREVKLADIHKLEMERRKKPKHDSPASFLRQNVEAIHQALAGR